MPQTQCPNCGGYRVETKEMLDAGNGKQLSRKTNFDRWFILTLPLGIGGSLMMTGLYLWGLPFLAVFVLLCVAGVRQVAARQSLRRLYHHYCELCGYRWSWVEGTPLPMVTIRPDLIQQGNQRLEQEERDREEQRRRDAAYGYMTHRDD